MINNQEIPERIKRYISEYDSVFVLENCDSVCKIFTRLISQAVEKKILLLVDELVWNSKPFEDNRRVFHNACLNGIFSIRPTEYGIITQVISHEEYRNIQMLFHMYEFSDRIQMLNRNTQYGSLENYIMNGLLTEEEAFMALMY